MNRDNRKDIERHQIERALAGLEDAVRRCREEDLRHSAVVAACIEELAALLDRNTNEQKAA